LKSRIYKVVIEPLNIMKELVGFTFYAVSIHVTDGTANTTLILYSSICILTLTRLQHFLKPKDSGLTPYSFPSQVGFENRFKPNNPIKSLGGVTYLPFPSDN